MEIAQYFIEVYTMGDKTYISPDFMKEKVYVKPVSELFKELGISKAFGFKTTFVWYIKPKTTLCKTIPSN